MTDEYKEALVDLVHVNINQCVPTFVNNGQDDVRVVCAEVVAAIVKNSRSLLDD